MLAYFWGTYLPTDWPVLTFGIVISTRKVLLATTASAYVTGTLDVASKKLIQSRPYGDVGYLSRSINCQCNGNQWSTAYTMYILHPHSYSYSHYFILSYFTSESYILLVSMARYSESSDLRVASEIDWIENICRISTSIFQPTASPSLRLETSDLFPTN